MTSPPPTTSDNGTTVLLRRDRPSPLEDLDGRLHLAQLRRDLASAAAEPIHFRQWDVERRLGHGAMGSVYLARHRQLGRWVALKVLNPRTDRAAAIHDARLVREAQALAKIHHENVVRIYQVDTTGGQTVIEMEYVEGPTLRAWQAGRPWRDAVSAYADAGVGLAAIHKAGFVHRDIKPDNLLRGGGGVVKVADLGLAIPVQSASSDAPSDPGASPALNRLTADGAIVGTLAYMAPEVIVGAPASAASDLFSLATSLYEAVHGGLPFQGDTPEAQATAIRAGKLAQPIGGPSAPTWLNSSLRRALECDPDRRHASVDAFVRELRHGLRRRRRRGLLGIIGATLVGLPGLTLWVSASPPDPCVDAGQPFMSLWDPLARAQLRSHAEAASAPSVRRSLDLLTRTFDDTTRSLASTASGLCRAERSTTTDAPIRWRTEVDLYARQRACLGYTYQHLRALIGHIGAAEREPSRHYADAVGRIEGLPRCEDPQDLAYWLISPDAAELDDAIAEVLAQASALESTGDYTAAADLAERAVQASAGASALSRAEALFRLGHILGEEHHYTEAYETLVKAREVAYGIGHDELVCRTGTFMAKLTANVGLDPATSTLELGLANACAERINARSVLLRADLLEARGLLALAADPAAAVQWHSAALALRGEYLGDLNHHTVKSVHNLANALAAARRRDAARQRYDEALARYEQLFGPDHVEVADVLFDLGEFLRETAPDEARSLLARASVIYARHLPIRGLASANIHIMLALIDLNGAPAEGVLAAAAEHLRQARALQRDAALGPYHPDRALLSRADGELALRQGAFPAAAQAFERATWLLARHGVSDAEIYDSILDGVEAHFGDGDFVVIARRAHDEGPAFLDHLMSVEPALRRGLTAWYIGDSLARESFPAESVAYLQVARAVYEAQPDPANVAELGWMIAQAIGAIPARRDEARGLAIASLAHYEGVSDRAMAAQISRWLERNAPGPRPTTSEP